MGDDDIRRVWTALLGTGTSGAYLLPTATTIVLQTSQLSGTLHSSRIQHSPISAPVDAWATLVTSPAQAENIITAAAPAGRIRFQMVSNNGNIEGIYAVHYGR